MQNLLDVAMLVEFDGSVVQIVKIQEELLIRVAKGEHMPYY